VVGVKALLAGLVLACSCAATAFADNPTVRISKEDQAKAEAALLKLNDFGAGWSGGPRPPDKLTSPNCPGFDPKESDLTVTGHAQARFTYSGSVIFEQDTQVLESPQAVQKDFERTIQPKLADCLAYQIKSSSKGQVKSVQVKQLTFPHTGAVSAAYRAYVTIRSGSRDAHIVSDFIFFGVGKFEYSLNVVAPVPLASQLSPFEQTMSKLLVKRASSAGNVA
jgi:hypothetical protein